MSYSVGQVAGLAGVTVRTLHHYDEVGLLSPSGRSAAGYASTRRPIWSGCVRSCSTGSSGSPWKRSQPSWTTRAPTRSGICATSAGC